MDPSAFPALAKRLLRQSSLAKLSAGKPAHLQSCMGGPGFGRPGETRPTWYDRPLLPCLWIRLDELPAVPPSLTGLAAIQLFLPQDDELPGEGDNGDGWVIREYAKLDDLQPLPTPADEDTAQLTLLTWNICEELPQPGDVEEALSLLGDIPEMSEEALEQFLEFLDTQPIELSPESYTKVGGYAADIQDALGAEGFAFQLSLVDEALPLDWLEYGIAAFHRSGSGWRCSVQLE